MSLHVQYYTKTLALSVMVGKLMGGALGMTLVDPTHRYAGSLLTSPGPSPAHAPALRHATQADGAAWAVWQFIQASYCIILRLTHISGGL